MTPGNAYTRGPVGAIFARTALPIVALTSLTGLQAVLDAVFLGVFVGPEALTAVTLVFPVSMLLVALATMVSSGMASALGRLLGAERRAEARAVFAGAHGLALALAVLAMGLFALAGWRAVVLAAGGPGDLAVMGHRYLGIAIYTAPLAFLLVVQSDALRSEGRIGFMALGGLLVTLANIVFTYALIVWAGLGVAGSAWGTALAQALALGVVAVYRARGHAPLRLGARDLGHWRAGWGEMLALGAPRSLNFIGVALGASVIMLSLRLHGGAESDAAIAAYGVITRIITFAFFPVLGMSMALQAMVSNNFGAGLWARSNATLKLALVVSLGYSALVEILLLGFRHRLGAVFVSDPVVIAEVARILPLFAALYFTFGPMMIIASYFQSIGDVWRAALLSLSRTYVFVIPLVFILPLALGERGVWLAMPIADGLLVLTTIAVLRARSGEMDWGLFRVA